MRRHGGLGACWLGAGLLALNGCCCQVSIGWPGAKPPFGPGPGGPPPPGMAPPGMFGLPPPGKPPEAGPNTPPPPPGPPPYEQVSLLSQKLAATQDVAKATMGRLHQLEGQVTEKDQALNLAVDEITAARDEMSRSRSDVQRWRQEMGQLKDRLQTSEKDNRTTLEAVIKVLEKLLDQERGPELP